MGQTGDKLADVPAGDPHIDEVFTVRAGKFRRYHGAGWHQLLDVTTQLQNFRDLIWVFVGFWQSFWLMRRLKPKVVFSRGGFVSVPVTLAGRLNHVPYITHDSDSMPSLANRLIARWAYLHAVALPAEVYPYPLAKTRVVGVPVNHQYEQVTARLMRHYRKLLHLQVYRHVLLVTGGGNGAQALNAHVTANADYLLSRYPELAILHIAGRALVEETNAAYDNAVKPADRKRVIVEGFVTDMYRYSGAADVIIARGGATNLAEFAIQAKACIIVPSPQLAWNVKNSRVMASHGAVQELSEAHAEQEQRLGRAVANLLDNPKQRQLLGKNLYKQAHPGSANELAKLIINVAETEN